MVDMLIDEGYREGKMRVRSVMSRWRWPQRAAGAGRRVDVCNYLQLQEYSVRVVVRSVRCQRPRNPKHRGDSGVVPEIRG